MTQMNNRIYFVLAFLVACSLSSCSESKKKALPSAAAPVRVLPTLPESELYLPVKVVIKPFLGHAESLAPRELTSTGWPEYFQTGCDFRYKYRFIRSAFQFNCVNNRVQVNMSGVYQIAGSKTVCAMGQPVYPWVGGSCGFGNEPMRKVNITLRSDLQFTPDYRLRTVTRAEKVQAVDRCLVTLFKTDVTQQVLDSIAASINAFGQSVDAMVSGINFDDYLQPIAEKAGKKIPLSTYGYMKLNASAVRLGAVNYSGDTLRFTAGVSCYPEVSSDSINYSVTRHLPPLTGTTSGNGFNLTANAKYDYTTIDTLLTKTLRNREFEVKGEKIRIVSVNVRGLDGYKVEFRIQFTGTKRGTLFLKGTPELDTALQVLSVPDLEYDLNSSSLALQLGKTFFSRKILENLRNQARINVTELYTKNKSRIDSQFNRVITDGVTLQGSTQGLKLTGLVINRDNVQVQANLKGNAGLVISNIP